MSSCLSRLLRKGQLSDVCKITYEPYTIRFGSAEPMADENLTEVPGYLFEIERKHTTRIHLIRQGRPEIVFRPVDSEFIDELVVEMSERATVVEMHAPVEGRTTLSVRKWRRGHLRLSPSTPVPYMPPAWRGRSSEEGVWRWLMSQSDRRDIALMHLLPAKLSLCDEIEVTQIVSETMPAGPSPHGWGGRRSDVVQQLDPGSVGELLRRLREVAYFSAQDNSPAQDRTDLHIYFHRWYDRPKPTTSLSEARRRLLP